MGRIRMAKRLRSDYVELRAEIITFVRENFQCADFTIHDLNPIAEKYKASFKEMSSCIGVLSRSKFLTRVAKVRTEKRWPQTNQVSLMRLVSDGAPKPNKNIKDYERLKAEKEQRAASAASMLMMGMNGKLQQGKMK